MLSFKMRIKTKQNIITMKTNIFAINMKREQLNEDKSLLWFNFMHHNVFLKRVCSNFQNINFCSHILYKNVAFARGFYFKKNIHEIKSIFFYYKQIWVR